MGSAKEVQRSRPGVSPEQAILDAIRAGFRARDPALIAGVYHADVEFRVINRNNPPAKPLVLRGADAVRRMFDDLCSREMTHDVVRSVVGVGSIAYAIECRYPDGCQVVGLNVATVKDGRIVNELSVDCWDE
jgi:hypothetical protein